ncbi:MAG TPA: sugar phosphate isomerase/epimerase family protein [Bryobacteraceae bacterium]|jgi:sugar phosphate isomerase/epimerase|nr:sugar phosphate isomerase/epimerase family protein [Bryobacteraceae bacterium]
MKLGLISSAWLGTSISVERGIELTREIGFDTIDIFGDPLEISRKERMDISKACTSAGLPVISTLCCALGIADFSAPVRRFHIDRAKRFLDLGIDLNAKNLLLVVGEYVWNREVIAPADQWNWAVEGTREIGEYATTLGLEVAVEIEPFELSVVNSIAKMDRFLREVGVPAVKANIDVSHLALVHDKPADIALLAGRIAHVHLSDCDGKKHGDLPPGRGVVDFPPFLRALKDTGFDGVISIELEYSPEPEKIVEWVREAYASSNALMSDLGIRN